MKYKIKHTKAAETFLWERGQLQFWGGYTGSATYSHERKQVATLPENGKWVLMLESNACEWCNGTGIREWTIGGDGYGNRCCGEMDVEGPCEECNGTGREPNGDHKQEHRGSDKASK